MFRTKLILATLLAGVSLGASADRADQRDEHYFWEKSDLMQPAAVHGQSAQPQRHVTDGRTLAFGARDALFVIPPSVRSRAEVIAELHEASRLGLISQGEADLRIATPAQEARIAAAGRSQTMGGVAARR